MPDTLALCQRQEATLRADLRQVETTLGTCTRSIPAIGRLMSVPAIGPLAATIYATVVVPRRQSVSGVERSRRNSVATSGKP